MNTELNKAIEKFQELCTPKQTVQVENTYVPKHGVTKAIASGWWRKGRGSFNSALYDQLMTVKIKNQ